MARGPSGGGGGPDAGWTPERSVAGSRNPWSIVAVISIATFMTVLDTSIVNVALEHIAGGLSADYDEATWVTTTFLAAQAIVIPASGWLANVVGRKRYYTISVALFTLASFACGIAPNLSLLILARIVQGAAGGGLAAVEQSMLVDTFPPSKRGLAFAAYGVVVVVGPIVGPILGGVITDNFSWRWCFLINVPVGALSLLLVNIFVDEPKVLIRERKRMLKNGLKFDFVGFILVGLFLSCLEVTLDRGQTDNWFANTTICITAIVSAVSFVLFVPWELTRDDPVVPLAMYGRRNFGLANILLLVTGVIIFGTTLFIPQLLQQVLGYTATDAGLALTFGGAATIVAMPIVGILSGKVDPRFLIGGAFLVEGFALLNMTHLDVEMSFGAAATARMFQAIGIPFLFVPITNVAYVGLAPSESNQASALMNVSRNLGGTIGISAVQTLLAQREQFHQARLVEKLDPLNPNYVQGIGQLTHDFASIGGGASMAGLSNLYNAVRTQAAMLSYIDVFQVLMIAVFACVPILFLMKGRQGQGGAPAGPA